MNGLTTCPSALAPPVCVETTTPVANGTDCGPNQVCNAGICTACSQGALCTSANLCASVATIACGTGTPVCTDQNWLPTGAYCGPAGRPLLHGRSRLQLLHAGPGLPPRRPVRGHGRHPVRHR